MDNEQRKYLLDRIRQQYNNVVEPLKAKKRVGAISYSMYECLEQLKRGDLSNVTDYYGDGSSFNLRFRHKTEANPGVDNTELIKKLSAEKDRVLDTIMLDGQADAAQILSDFISYLKKETEKVNNGN